MAPYNFPKPLVSIGIPVHGLSQKLLITVKACLECSRAYYSIAAIYIVNSGPSFSFPNQASFFDININISVKDVPSDYYWSRSVADIYSLFEADASSHLLLMNHDCHPSVSCFDNLVVAHQHLGADSVCHSLLIDNFNSDIWWSGTYLIPFLRQRFRSCRSDTINLSTPPIPTSSTMGQCLLMPRAAVNRAFLHYNLLPHYFADSVQTSIMRRKGFKLFVVPQSVAYVDQTDQYDKLQWLRTNSISDICKVFCHPKSSRNLTAVFYSTLLHRDSFSVGITCAIYEVIGDS